MRERKSERSEREREERERRERERERRRRRRKRSTNVKKKIKDSRILSTSAGVGGSTVTRRERERAQGLPSPSKKRVPVFCLFFFSRGGVACFERGGLRARNTKLKIAPSRAACSRPPREKKGEKKEKKPFTCGELDDVQKVSVPRLVPQLDREGRGVGRERGCGRRGAERGGAPRGRGCCRRREGRGQGGGGDKQQQEQLLLLLLPRGAKHLLLPIAGGERQRERAGNKGGSRSSHGPPFPRPGGENPGRVEKV